MVRLLAAAMMEAAGCQAAAFRPVTVDYRADAARVRQAYFDARRQAEALLPRDEAAIHAVLTKPT